MSMSIDSLNIMVLHAFVPDSLLHINIEGIQLASDKSNVLETTSEIAPYLSLKSVEGKILKSPKEVSLRNDFAFLKLKLKRSIWIYCCRIFTIFC